MAQTTLSVRIDENDKKQFEAFCNETGMNVSVAINIFVKTVLREQKLPFTIQTDSFYNPTNIERLERSIRQMETTGGTIHEVNLDD